MIEGLTLYLSMVRGGRDNSCIAKTSLRSVYGPHSLRFLSWYITRVDCVMFFKKNSVLDLARKLEREVGVCHDVFAEQPLKT